MTFLAFGRLWLMLLVPALISVYVALEFRRRRSAVRFTNLALLESVAPRRPAWRRHLPAAAFVLMLASMVTAFARPPAWCGSRASGPPWWWPSTPRSR